VIPANGGHRHHHHGITQLSIFFVCTERQATFAGVKKIEIFSRQKSRRCAPGGGAIYIHPSFQSWVFAL